jgi:EAL domain-containing protein (putative c-di-GMP-specific phosphodiesterase class I)
VACAAAKEKGRNRIQVYEHNNVDLLRRRGEFRWVSRIQSALHDGRFVLHAQRIQPLRADPGPPHYEVLVRMLDEHGEPVPPGSFMPAAEHYHLMPAIDRWVVQRVIADLSAAAKRPGGAPLQLSVNLSGQSLSDDQVRARTCELLQGLGPLARNLCFEITESAVIANMDQALEFIAALKAVGCRCSLDDFGSGLSSFAYLQRFDVDFLKIDGSFVRRLGEDRVAEAMVSAINQVGQVMGLSTVAEFVENGVIHQRLRALGVDYGQGYHYHRPEPLRHVLRGLTLSPRAVHG